MSKSLTRMDMGEEEVIRVLSVHAIVVSCTSTMENLHVPTPLPCSSLVLFQYTVKSSFLLSFLSLSLNATSKRSTPAGHFPQPRSSQSRSTREWAYIHAAYSKVHGSYSQQKRKHSVTEARSYSQWQYPFDMVPSSDRRTTALRRCGCCVDYSKDAWYVQRCHKRRFEFMARYPVSFASRDGSASVADQSIGRSARYL